MMTKFSNVKMRTKIAIIVSLVILVASLVTNVIGVVLKADELPEGALIHIAINPIMLILVFYYVLFGYRKPHGNALRYIFLVFALFMVLQSITPTLATESWANTLVSGSAGVSAVLTAYVGARLHKIEQNKIIMNIAGALLLTGIIVLNCASPVFSVGQLIGSLALFSGWSALCFSYLARYEEHKAAGLADKADA